MISNLCLYLFLWNKLLLFEHLIYELRVVCDIQLESELRIFIL